MFEVIGKSEDMTKLIETVYYKYTNTCETYITDYYDENSKITFHFTFKTYKNIDGYLTSIVLPSIWLKGELIRVESCEVLLQFKVRCSKSAVIKQHNIALSQYDSIRRKAIEMAIEESNK